MRFIVYGAGAIGGALGAYLWDSGKETLLIARGAHLERMRADGLRVVSGDGARTYPVPVVGSPSDIDFRPGDAVLLTMKAQDTEQALRDLLDAGTDPWNTPIFCVQNCIANEPIASRYFERVFGVMIVIPGIHLEPGIVFNPITGNHGFMDVGRYPRGIDEGAEQFVEAMQAAGYAAAVHPDVMASKGAKFLGNLGNAMGAITDGRGDEGPYMQQVRAEARTVLQAAGLPVEPEDTYTARVKANRGTDVPMEGIQGNRGSSWQSLKRGRGTIETDFLNGEVRMLGRIHGIDTPYNAVLQRVANDMARRGEQPGKYSVEELAAMAMKHSRASGQPAR